MTVRVQEADFDPGAAIAALAAGRQDIGGIATFVGLVRGGPGDVAAMTLEHYPGMTERQLAAIEDEARRRFAVDDVLIIHRFGRLLPGDRIVFVGVAAAHRAAAFAACEFLIDWLKTRAPFWKREEGPAGEHWVAAKDDDEARTGRWKA